MSLDTIPIGDAVQQRDVGPISFIPLLGVAASLLPYPKTYVAWYSEFGDAVLVSIPTPTIMLASSSGSRVPALGMRLRWAECSSGTPWRSRIPFPLKHILGTDSPKQNRHRPESRLLWCPDGMVPADARTLRKCTLGLLASRKNFGIKFWGSSYSDADTVSLAWRNKNVPSTEAIPSSSSVGVLPFRFQIAHIPKAKSGAIPSFIYLSTKLVIFWKASWPRGCHSSMLSMRACLTSSPLSSSKACLGMLKMQAPTAAMVTRKFQSWSLCPQLAQRGVSAVSSWISKRCGSAV